MVELDTFTLHISRDKYYLRYEWFVNSFLIRSLGINNTDECIIKLEIIKSSYLINISCIFIFQNQKFRYKILINRSSRIICVELRIETKFHEKKKGILMPFVYIYISRYELGRFINEVVQFRK